MLNGCVELSDTRVQLIAKNKIKKLEDFKILHVGNIIFYIPNTITFEQRIVTKNIQLITLQFILYCSATICDCWKYHDELIEIRTN